MDLGLKGKTAIVTAASGGLGIFIAEEFAREGAQVILSARDPERLDAAVERIQMISEGSAKGMIADMTDAAAVTAMVQDVDKTFGGIDIVVANSGGADTSPFGEMSDQKWRDAAEVKIIAQLRLAREVFNSMVQRGTGGRLIFMAGTHGRQPHAHAITAGFCNAALQNVSKAIAEEGGPHDILSNVVNPGPFATQRMIYLAEEKAREDGISLEEATAILANETVLKRYGQPEELAAFIVFLASQRASYITGSTFDIDGGQVKAL